ncbi:MAG: DUF1592 domain-containing protein, partial [Bacteroidota bacterium]
MRLLTRREYQNTARDLLGDPFLPAFVLPADQDDAASRFPFHATAPIAVADAILYRNAAETLAKTAVKAIATVLPCAATAASADGSDSTCVAAFLAPAGFAAKVYRRPLASREVTRLTALFATARAQPHALGFADAAGLVIEAMLQSSGFLYHWEVDPVAAVRDGKVVKLGGYEIANRLSYLLWGPMPDGPLFAAAAAGQLADLAGVDAQVRRMLKDPRSAGAMADFFTDWL